jgi:hypothetical protein
MDGDSKFHVRLMGGGPITTEKIPRNKVRERLREVYTPTESTPTSEGQRLLRRLIESNRSK